MARTQSPPWTLSPEAFERLLTQLGPDREHAAREYQRVRGRLHDFFDCRGCDAADVLADETLDRVARRLAAGEDVQRLANYAYGVARRVLFEWQKRRTREEAALSALRRFEPDPQSAADMEVEVACL